ncbi:uncharacterized protein LOC127710520 [Mytilus californianus]|uniref:uncharacterized protein LOC127710520 n=1 Tax=Mytilus californianus TaxID=6549 RepID=UPI002248417A|nr:uncharacterized protein LOC127710520 [Mytilus californianus]
MSADKGTDVSKVKALVNAMHKQGIRLLAMDFDQTLISIHSGGRWKETIENLVKEVRPCMKDLIPACLEKGIYVAIVTYSAQSWLIKDLMKNLYDRDALKIVVRGNTSDFLERNNYEINGKEAHIADVLTSLYKNRHEIIKPNEVILFDDDTDNTKEAKKFGHWAVEVKEDISYDTFTEISAMFQSKSSK